jgi:hypothetical protein
MLPELLLVFTEMTQPAMVCGPLGARRVRSSVGCALQHALKNPSCHLVLVSSELPNAGMCPQLPRCECCSKLPVVPPLVLSDHWRTLSHVPCTTHMASLCHVAGVAASSVSVGHVADALLFDNL